MDIKNGDEKLGRGREEMKKSEAKRQTGPFPSLVPYDNPPVPIQHKPERGETDGLVRHMKMISDSKVDYSKDQDWEIHPFGCFDVFLLGTFALGVFISIVPLGLMIFVFLLPPTLMNYCYFKGISPGTAELDRASCGWKAHVFGQFVLSLFAQMLIFLQLMISVLLMQFIGIIYCTLTCRWAQYRRNLKHLQPYNNGPCLYSHFADCVAATGGQMVRQGYCEFIISFVMMFSVNPWVKYWLSANPYLEDLGERFITQIGPSMHDIPLKQLEFNFQKFISWTRLEPEERDKLDNDAFFCPHYPFPPRKCPAKAEDESKNRQGEGDGEYDRQYAIGMQHAMAITTFVHTTHFHCPGLPVSSISSSVKLPVYRVMLWRNNPYHIYTGYVEAGVSNGEKSTGKNDMGLEHPMWLVNGRSWSSAARAQRLSIGWIDDYFEHFIPQLNRLIRGNVTGHAVAWTAYIKDKERVEKEVAQVKAEECLKIGKPMQVRPATTMP